MKMIETQKINNTVILNTGKFIYYTSRTMCRLY